MRSLYSVGLLAGIAFMVLPRVHRGTWRRGRWWRGLKSVEISEPGFDKALAECKTDSSWRTSEIASGHLVMLDAPEWLAAQLLQSA
jgi:hypothetical protein